MKAQIPQFRCRECLEAVKIGSTLPRATKHSGVIFRPEEGVFEHPHHPPVNAGFLAFASAGHIEAFDAMLSDKFLKAQSGVIEESTPGGDVDARFLVLSGELNGPQGTARNLGCERENHRAVRIFDVPFRPLEVGCRRRFENVVAGRDRPILGTPPLGTPAAVGEIVLQRHVQCGDVGPGLAS